MSCYSSRQTQLKLKQPLSRCTICHCVSQPFQRLVSPLNLQSSHSVHEGRNMIHNRSPFSTGELPLTSATPAYYLDQYHFHEWQLRQASGRLWGDLFSSLSLSRFLVIVSCHPVQSVTPWEGSSAHNLLLAPEKLSEKTMHIGYVQAFCPVLGREYFSRLLFCLFLVVLCIKAP